jgi:hypothetical protein
VPHHHVVLGVAQHRRQVVNGQLLLHLPQHVGNLVAEQGRAAAVAQRLAEDRRVLCAVLLLRAQVKDGAHTRSNWALQVQQGGDELIARGRHEGHD